MYRTRANISRGLYIFLSHFSLRLVLQTIYVLNKEIWAKNPRFIIEIGFKSKAGYNGARTVCKTCRNNIIHSALFYAIVQTPLPQCPRTDLNKRFLPRPKTTTALKLIPHRSKISKNWNLHGGSHYIDFSKIDFY